MNRYEFYDKYKLFMPITHIHQFELDLYNVIHDEAWLERFVERDEAGQD